jgi:hypothetical protein
VSAASSASSLASPPILSSIYPEHRWKMQSLIRVSLALTQISSI